MVSAKTSRKSGRMQQIGCGSGKCNLYICVLLHYQESEKQYIYMLHSHTNFVPSSPGYNHSNQSHRVPLMVNLSFDKWFPFVSKNGGSCLPYRSRALFPSRMHILIKKESTWNNIRMCLISKILWILRWRQCSFAQLSFKVYLYRHDRTMIERAIKLHSLCNIAPCSKVLIQ